jgi:hypothetical protein
MSGFAKLREGSWHEQEIRNLEGDDISATQWVRQLPKVVKVVCFDGMGTGLYVLTDDDDTYFTVHSIALDFIDDIRMLELMEEELA